ncbi:hypothetical protein L1999_19280 [Neobacillus drentensis]|uniref:hypothetical protein n=1 Tax=Neobacillus drentensis TaxID=220684 RepID=UPI001F24B07F|nr:hypothetical protein [Neobacillus drentensis]ULT55241.1 hypothetical protein L1999_19280 [Neobacillus drentensis]
MTDSEFPVIKFHIKSRAMGEFSIKRIVKDLSALEKIFDAVKLNISISYVDGSILNLPLLPKIKDDKGNVYCDLDEEGERILKEYVGLK